jgi:hypothetical protein
MGVSHMKQGIVERPISNSRLPPQIRHEDRLGALFIKPGFFPLDQHGNPFQDNLESLIRSLDIDIIATNELTLTPREVKTTYYSMFETKEPSETLQRVRTNLLQYLVGSPIFCYLLAGDDIVNKLDIIKKTIRKQYGFVKGGTDVKSLIHTPEPHDIMHDINTFFLYRPHNEAILKRIWE